MIRENGPECPKTLLFCNTMKDIAEVANYLLFKLGKERLPRWATAVKQVLLIQPSSAAAERVFSILKASFNEQQDCALVDYIQASVMAQYNKR